VGRCLFSDLQTIIDAQGVGYIVSLSVGVSLSAATLATLLGIPLGAALAVYRIQGRRIFIIALHALLGVPPVVVGLALYLLLSRSGPFGRFGLLFTPGAMILAQTYWRCRSSPHSCTLRRATCGRNMGRLSRLTALLGCAQFLTCW
jgi:ABC-type tungstate transport system substrate-binding protein